MVASEKAEEFTHTSKLRIDILQLERKLSGLYVKLGLYVFAKTNEKNVLNFVGDKRYLGLVENVVDIKKRINEGQDIIGRKDNFIKVNLDNSFPKFLINNQSIYSDWLIL